MTPSSFNGKRSARGIPVEPYFKREGSASPHVLDLRHQNIPPEEPTPLQQEFERASYSQRTTDSVLTRVSQTWHRTRKQLSPVRAVHCVMNGIIGLCRACGEVVVVSGKALGRAMRMRREVSASRQRATPWSPPEEFRPAIPREVSWFIVVSFVMMIAIGIVQSIPGAQSQKDKLLQQGSRAVAQVMASTDALTSGQWQQSMESIEAARHSFEEIEQQLKSPDSWALKVAAALPFTTQYRQAQQLARIGTDLSTSAELILEAAEALEQSTLPMGEKLQILDRTTKNVSNKFIDAQQVLQRVSTLTLDERIQPLVGELQASLGASSKTFGQFSQLFGALNQAVGDQRLKRYLVIFENSDEMRPSGGFMGSFVLVDVVDGVITDQQFPKGGSYDLQGSLSVAVRPPAPLAVFRPVWQFHDTNWFADWPTSAKNIQWFYEHSGGPSIDGVVAITSPLLERVLDITGPITLKGETITSKNVIERVQRKVEFEYDKTKNNPKEYIGELALALQSKLSTLNQQQLIELFRLVDSSIRERLVMVSTTDSLLNDRLRQLGALGEIKQTDGDYASVVWSNIGGEKTDRVIENDIHITTTVQPDGALENELTIDRRHNGIPGQTFYGVTNTSYLRVYVPNGATLIKADGFIKPPRALKKSSLALEDLPDVQEYPARSKLIAQTTLVQTEEFGKTVFGGWVTLPAGGEDSVVLRYRLPMQWTSNRSHTLLYQKQPGGLHASVSYTIMLPNKSTVIAAAPEETSTLVRDNIITFQSQPLLFDRMYGALAQF